MEPALEPGLIPDTRSARIGRRVGTLAQTIRGVEIKMHLVGHLHCGSKLVGGTGRGV